MAQVIFVLFCCQHLAFFCWHRDTWCGTTWESPSFYIAAFQKCCQSFTPLKVLSECSMVCVCLCGSPWHALWFHPNAPGPLIAAAIFFLSDLALEADIHAKAGVVVAVAKAAIRKADHDPGTGNKQHTSQGLMVSCPLMSTATSLVFSHIDALMILKSSTFHREYIEQLYHLIKHLISLILHFPHLHSFI